MEQFRAYCEGGPVPIRGDQTRCYGVHVRIRSAVMEAELERIKGHLAFLLQLIGYYKVLYSSEDSQGRIF